MHYLIGIKRTIKSFAVNGTTVTGCTLAQGRVAATHPVNDCMGMAATSCDATNEGTLSNKGGGSDK